MEPPVPVKTNTKGIGGQPVVQPDGRVVVPINGFNGQRFTLLSFISTDGGTSWSNPGLVTKVAYHTPAGGSERASHFHPRRSMEVGAFTWHGPTVGSRRDARRTISS